MRVLVACEWSGIVRDAFIEEGHDAISCDLIPTEQPGPHFQGDVRELLCGDEEFDLMIAHPPCTDLASSGARWFRQKLEANPDCQLDALGFVEYLMNAPIKKIAIENPIGIISSNIRTPDQIIQPWQFGHGEVKATCLWLKNLPPLERGPFVDGRYPRVHRAAPSEQRSKMRGKTYSGIARAMARQWGCE
jgi:site-specific DNA-cytosine methylase|tara:strand:+ start:5135 stop:5704 length:570 start_codon:yes stop_codon:yes gene_type:complete